MAYANLVGISGHAASAAPYVVGLCLAAAAWTREQARQRGDEAAFLLGVLGLLAFSPIVWHHYLVLLFVPLAIYCPRFAPDLAAADCCAGWSGEAPSSTPARRSGSVFLVVVAGIGAWMLTRGRAAAGRRPRLRRGTLPAWR